VKKPALNSSAGSEILGQKKQRRSWGMQSYLTQVRHRCETLVAKISTPVLPADQSRQ